MCYYRPDLHPSRRVRQGGSIAHLQPVDELLEAAVRLEGRHVDVGDEVDHAHGPRHELKHRQA